VSELASPPSGAAAPRPARSRSQDPDSPLAEREPTGHGAPVASTVPPAQSSGTITGMLLAGRYRLRTRVGSDTAAGAEFWRAEDTILRRDVAISVLRRLTPESEDPDAAADGTGGGTAILAPATSPAAGGTAAEPGPGQSRDGDGESVGTTRAGEMMVKALRSGSFEHAGCARLLDVLAPGTGGMPADVLGAAVTEWVPGRSLAEVVADGLTKPTAVARGVAPLAAAAEAAHRRGLVLGIDHPQRVRVTPEGKVQVGFALPRPSVTPADDVRGLGAVLYALLTAQWPLSGVDAARAGLAAAARGPNGEVRPPSQERPGVPVELDALTRGTLSAEGAPGHVHTAAAVHQLLDEVIGESDRLALFPPEHDGVPSSPGDVWQDDGGSRRPDPGRRRKLTIGVSVLAAAVVAVLVFLSIQFGSLFSEGSGGPAIVVGASPGGSQPAAGADPAAGAPDAGAVGVAAVAGVKVYTQSGDRDNSGKVSQVIDGDDGSSWKTSTYKQQFPALKPGIGIMVSFASAVQLAEMSVESPSAGTQVEIRSADSADADVDETTKIGEATLQEGRTTISLSGSQPVTHVLVWITQLSGGGSDYTSQIDELEFRRAGGA
jgi:hypothetical protein